MMTHDFSMFKEYFPWNVPDSEPRGTGGKTSGSCDAVENRKVKCMVECDGLSGMTGMIRTEHRGSSGLRDTVLGASV